MTEIQAGKIVVLRKVRGDCPFSNYIVAEPGVYIPFLNPYGAVSVEINGELLGLKPDEFQWLDKPPREIYEGEK
jgi:hypothetical protein